MARFSGKAASVTAGSLKGFFNNFNLRVSQNVDNVSAYGDTGNGAQHLGSGTLVWNAAFGGFADDANAPGLAHVIDAASSYTFTATTGKTFTGSFLGSSGGLASQKLSATGVVFEAIGNGDIAEAWGA